jgi:hypothetical protein
MLLIMVFFFMFLLCIKYDVHHGFDGFYQHSQQHILDFVTSLKNDYCFFYYVYNYLVTKIIM